jgi:Tfp pilus assembly protein PilX
MKNKLRSSYNSKRLQRKAREAGVALIIALLILLVISMLAAGVIFSTQSEVWASANYRNVTQARYVAEAGAQQAANWIIQNWTPPSNFTTTTAFNLSVFPAMYVGGSTPSKIVFSSSNISGITDTYTNISSSLDSSFQTNLSGISSPFASENANANFSVAAQLLSATQVTVGGGPQWLTKWKIISQGSVGQIQPAKVQVVEIMADVPTASSSSQTIPNFNYGILATGTGCNVITASGGSGNPGRTNAYNSQASGNAGNSNPTLLGTGGSVATFGNVKISNGAYINGPIYSPYYNAGASGTYGISCPSWTAVCGNNSSGWNGDQACSSPSKLWSVNEDNSGGAVGCTNGGSCANTTSNLPASLPNPSSIPDPTMPTVTPNTSACTALAGGLCNGGSGGASGCSATLPPSPTGTSYGQVNFGSCARITLQSGTYNFDTLLISNGATITVPSTGNVVINIYNSSASSTPFTSNGGTVVNPGGDPNNLTFVYDGSNTINLANGAALFATVYAPHAPVTVSGNGGLYGAIVANTFAFSGSGHVIYDTHLASDTPHVTYGGSAVTNTAHLDEFSWSAY